MPDCRPQCCPTPLAHLARNEEQISDRRRLRPHSLSLSAGGEPLLCHPLSQHDPPQDQRGKSCVCLVTLCFLLLSWHCLVCLPAAGVRSSSDWPTFHTSDALLLLYEETCSRTAPFGSFQIFKLTRLEVSVIFPSCSSFSVFVCVFRAVTPPFANTVFRLRRYRCCYWSELCLCGDRSVFTSTGCSKGPGRLCYNEAFLPCQSKPSPALLRRQRNYFFMSLEMWNLLWQLNAFAIFSLRFTLKEKEH